MVSRCSAGRQAPSSILSCATGDNRSRSFSRRSHHTPITPHAPRCTFRAPHHTQSTQRTPHTEHTTQTTPHEDKHATPPAPHSPRLILKLKQYTKYENNTNIISFSTKHENTRIIILKPKNGRYIEQQQGELCVCHLFCFGKNIQNVDVRKACKDTTRQNVVQLR